ncbi:hypothetical protein [Cupriavidus sp.]|jgi:hypothetical protein|nr:hypothetical protein [Cupriavidus sp.]
MGLAEGVALACGVLNLLGVPLFGFRYVVRLETRLARIEAKMGIGE